MKGDIFMENEKWGNHRNDSGEKVIMETERLYLREMRLSDCDALCRIMCDEETMRAAYNSAFTREEVQGWLERQLARYRKYGFGLWAVVRRDTGEMIGQCGLTMQPWDGREVLEIGYLFQRAHWHHGYAIEAARACKQYAFTVLNAGEVHSMIRDTHVASRSVAERNGMTVADRRVRRFRNEDMLFCDYTAKRPSGEHA